MSFSMSVLEEKGCKLPAVHDDGPSGRCFQPVLLYIQHQLQQWLGTVGCFVVRPGCVPVVFHTPRLTPLLEIASRFFMHACGEQFFLFFLNVMVRVSREI